MAFRLVLVTIVHWLCKLPFLLLFGTCTLPQLTSGDAFTSMMSGCIEVSTNARTHSSTKCKSGLELAVLSSVEQMEQLGSGLSTGEYYHVAVSYQSDAGDWAQYKLFSHMLRPTPADHYYDQVVEPWLVLPSEYFKACISQCLCYQNVLPYDETLQLPAGEFQWSDGSVVQANMWMSGEPTGATDKCGALSKETSTRLVMVTCESSYKYICGSADASCQSDLLSVSQTTSKTTFQTSEIMTSMKSNIKPSIKGDTMSSPVESASTISDIISGTTTSDTMTSPVKSGSTTRDIVSSPSDSGSATGDIVSSPVMSGKTSDTMLSSAESASTTIVTYSSPLESITTTSRNSDLYSKTSSQSSLETVASHPNQVTRMSYKTTPASDKSTVMTSITSKPVTVSLTSSKPMSSCSLSPFSSCRCRCSNNQKVINLTKTELVIKINELKASLIIAKDTLSAKLRHKTSANDDRLTAIAAGVVGVTVLVVVSMVIVAMDFGKFSSNVTSSSFASAATVGKRGVSIRQKAKLNRT